MTHAASGLGEPHDTPPLQGTRTQIQQSSQVNGHAFSTVNENSMGTLDSLISDLALLIFKFLSALPIYSNDSSFKNALDNWYSGYSNKVTESSGDDNFPHPHGIDSPGAAETIPEQQHLDIRLATKTFRLDDPSSYSMPTNTEPETVQTAATNTSQLAQPTSVSASEETYDLGRHSKPIIENNKPLPEAPESASQPKTSNYTASASEIMPKPELVPASKPLESQTTKSAEAAQPPNMPKTAIPKTAAAKPVAKPFVDHPLSDDGKIAAANVRQKHEPLKLEQFSDGQLAHIADDITKAKKDNGEIDPTKMRNFKSGVENGNYGITTENQKEAAKLWGETYFALPGSAPSEATDDLARFKDSRPIPENNKPLSQAPESASQPKTSNYTASTSEIMPKPELVPASEPPENKPKSEAGQPPNMPKTAMPETAAAKPVATVFVERELSEAGKKAAEAVRNQYNIKKDLFSDAQLSQIAFDIQRTGNLDDRNFNLILKNKFIREIRAEKHGIDTDEKFAKVKAWCDVYNEAGFPDGKIATKDLARLKDSKPD